MIKHFWISAVMNGCFQVKLKTNGIVRETFDFVFDHFGPDTLFLSFHKLKQAVQLDIAGSDMQKKITFPFDDVDETQAIELSFLLKIH